MRPQKAQVKDKGLGAKSWDLERVSELRITPGLKCLMADLRGHK
jgi:hypothetical protein